MGNNELPPPPKLPSEPPAVKVARVQWDALENITAIIGASVLLFYGKITPEVWGPVVAAASFGAGALRAFGAKRAGVVSVLPWLLAAKFPGAAKLLGGAGIGRTLMVLPLMLALHGCAGEPPRVNDARAALNSMADGMNVIGEGVARARGLLAVICKPPEPQECTAARRELDNAALGFNLVAAGHKAAQDAVDVLGRVAP